MSLDLCALLFFVEDKAEKGEEKDSTVMTQSEETPTEEDLLGPNCYYDKSKSFFDNISSELKTRSGPECTVGRMTGL